MDELLRFLSVEANRTILAWVGGGISTAAVGLWIVIKYLLELQKRPAATKSTAAVDKSTNNSVSVHSGVAVGAGGNLHAGAIHIGFGLKALFITSLLLGAVLLVAAFLADRMIAPAIAANNEMKPYTFELVCGSGKRPYTLESSEAESLQKFEYFLSENHTKPIYLRVSITKACAACECPRNSPVPDDLVMNENGVVSIELGEKKTGWKIAKMMAGAYKISAFGPPFPLYLAVYLPSYEQLPNNGQYSRFEYGTFLTYEGPFVAYYFDGTGFSGGYVEPMSVMTGETLQQVDCIRNSSEWSAFQKFVKGCRPPLVASN